MRITDITIILVSVVSCLISTVLLLRDYKIKNDKYNKDQKETDGNNDHINKKGICIYCVIMSLISVLISSMFVFVYNGNDLWFSLKRVILLSVMWPIAYIDFKTYRIPNVFILYGLISRAIILIFELIFGRNYIGPIIKSEIIASAVLIVSALLCTIIIKNSIGFGDIKLFLVMGLMQGIDGVWSSVFLSLIISFTVAVVLLISRKKTRKDAIPFGPSLVIGTFISIFLTGM